MSRLGEELNLEPDQGILELAKNTYDANSINWTIELLDTCMSGGTVNISNDGDGMESEGIGNGWLYLENPQNKIGGILQ